jgi:CheY-like chemotaxis protein
MRALVVEDDRAFADELARILRERLRHPPSHIAFAQSRDSAYSYLDQEFFDLLLLDLKIPTVDGALDADPRHGLAVFGRARQIAPGTPIFVLTGSPAEDFIPDLLAGQQHVDIWGEGRKVGTVEFLKKYRFDEAPAKLEPIADAVWALSEVELDRGDTDLGLEDDRLVRIFARRVGGTRCVAKMIGGGLSNAKVIRLKVTDVQGAPVYDAVAKLGSIAEVRDESERFETHVARLDPATTPRKLQTLEFGAKAQAAVFYGLADGFNLDGFGVCLRPEDLFCSVPTILSEATRRWREGIAETRRSVREIRRRLISDEDFQRVTKPHNILWLNDFESRQIQTHWGCVHGDLHGGNVLVSEDGTCVLIDYGDVGEGPASLDGITLEFSLLFHPKGPLRTGGWPAPGQASQWANLDQYLIGCPAAGFIAACRGWANEVAAGQREVAASAYSYLVRQFKYVDTDKNLVLELLEAVHTWFMST